MDEKNKVDIAGDEIIARKFLKDDSKKGYNFVGTDHHWTTIEEQKNRVKEIENKTKRK